MAGSEALARDAIAHVVADTEARFSPETLWPLHPRDADNGAATPAYPLYHGACGVIWALTYLEAAGAATLTRPYGPCIDALRKGNAAWLATFRESDASYLMGDVPWLLLDYGLRPRDATLDRLECLIETNVDHPARELMWGSPGTMLAALFLHERTGSARWAELFRATANKAALATAVVGRVQMRVLDAGPVRPLQHVPRRRPRVRRHRAASDPRTTLARR